jgi:hypothetical protein
VPLNPTKAPVETKVAAQSSTTIVVGIIVWILVNYVPLFKSGIPESLSTFLPFIVSGVLGTISGWSSSHTPRLEEALKQSLPALQTLEKEVAPLMHAEIVSSPVPATEVHIHLAKDGESVTSVESGTPGGVSVPASSSTSTPPNKVADTPVATPAVLRGPGGTGTGYVDPHAHKDDDWSSTP